MDDPVIREKVEDFFRRCREGGMNITPQRLAVYRALIEAQDHPSPETLHARMRRTMPAMSIATIQKALAALEKLGLVQEISVISEATRWDANVERHQHLVCRACKRVIDVHEPQLEAFPLPKSLEGFVPEGVSVLIRGLCAACAEEPKRAGTG